MRRMGVVCAVAGWLISAAALAEVSPFVSEVRQAYDRLKPNILNAAEKMPAENYGFKPTADIRSFARVVNHITEAQMHICGAAIHADTSAEKTPPETADKATILAALRTSFDVCDKAYAGITETNQAEVLQAGPFTRSRLGLLWGNVAHDDEQYATLSLYLRLKGLTPPTAEK